MILRQGYFPTMETVENREIEIFLKIDWQYGFFRVKITCVKAKASLSWMILKGAFAFFAFKNAGKDLLEEEWNAIKQKSILNGWSGYFDCFLQGWCDCI